ASRKRGDGVAVAHSHRQDARRNQQASARIDAEGAKMVRAGFALLDERRLPGVLIDCKHSHVVLATIGGLRALEVDDAGIAVGNIDEPPSGMDVDRACGLRRADVARIGKRRLDEHGVGREKVIRLQFVDIQLILALDRDEHPWQSRMEVEVPGPKSEAVARRDRRLVREYAIVEAEDLERAGIFWLALPGIVAARDGE